MRKILLFILTFSMIVSFALPFASVAAEEEAADVIEIDTAEELAAIENNLAGNYKLTADIVATTGITGSFTGTFDGDGHKISGLTTALFQQISGATVKNLTVSGDVVDSSSAAKQYGAIVIESIERSGTVENVIAEGTLTYDFNYLESYVGGVVGNCWAGSGWTEPNPEINIIGCTNRATINVIDPHKLSTGGVIGFVGGYGIVNITECVNEGEIIGTYTSEVSSTVEASIAGIVGRAYENTSNNREGSGDMIQVYITRCANLAPITLTGPETLTYKGNVAGIICQMTVGSIKYCYNVGNLVHNGTGETKGILAYQNGKNNGSNKNFSMEYCYNISETPVNYEFCPGLNKIDWNALMIQGNCFLSREEQEEAVEAIVTNQYAFGGLKEENLNHGIGNFKFKTADSMFEKLVEFGYVMDYTVGYPVLPFQLKNLTLEHTENDGSSFFYQQNTTDASLIRVIGLLDTEVAKSASAIEVTFSNGSDTKVFTIDNATAYSSIDATFDGVEVTYVACDGAVILGWVFKGVPENYVPTTVEVVK